MTKKQKIWFAVFLAMFVVPEVLWGQYIGLLVYGIISALTNHWGTLTYIGLLPLPQAAIFVKIIALIKFFGIVVSFLFLLFFYSSNKIIKGSLVILFLLLIFFAGYALLFSLLFNPQIG